MWLCKLWVFPVDSVVKKPPAKQETHIRLLDQENPLKEKMTTHSRIFAWRIPWTDETGRLHSMWSRRVRHDWAAKQEQQCILYHTWQIQAASPQLVVENIVINIGLAKKFIWVYPYNITAKPKLTFWPTQYKGVKAQIWHKDSWSVWVGSCKSHS